MSKTCSKCKREKPLDEYYRDRSRADGLNYVCKACVSEQTRAWKKANRERVAETNRTWYEANRERRLEMSRTWYEANRERRLEMSRAWYEANPERKAKASRAWAKANPEKVAGQRARTRAKYPERYAARIAVMHAVQRGDFPPASALSCSVCGEPAEHYHHHLGYAPEHRLDVVAVCLPCHIELHKEIS